MVIKILIYDYSYSFKRCLLGNDESLCIPRTAVSKKQHLLEIFKLWYSSTAGFVESSTIIKT